MNVNRVDGADDTYPQQDIMKMVLYLWSSSSPSKKKIKTHQSNHEKNLIIEEQPIKYPIRIPQNFHGYQKQRKSETLLLPRGA